MGYKPKNEKDTLCLRINEHAKLVGLKARYKAYKTDKDLPGSIGKFYVTRKYQNGGTTCYYFNTRVKMVAFLKGVNSALITMLDFQRGDV